MARRKTRPALIPFVVALAAIAGWWWLAGEEPEHLRPEESGTFSSQIPLATTRPESPAVTQPDAAVTEKGSTPQVTPTEEPPPPTEDRIQSLLKAGKQAILESRSIDARRFFSEALALGGSKANGAETAVLRAELTRIANETLFSARVMEGDPFVDRYVVQSGDSLGKIAKQNLVSADLLAQINNLKNKNMIRVGQSLKVIKGPFHARIDRDAFRMDVFLNDTLVKHYRVGLGEDGSTPNGGWRVTTKLVNPTYYPPRGGQIVAADDPENPLGERWIGLHGVSGEAVGQQRYGIHGTTEPESIGKNASLGCVRLFNEDVEELYSLLVENHSQVEIY